ncbi:pentatricopeptide repeat-containing protein [Senna tora]|uniref:Pentatricopeptide repeat-containing protein n=1 Tax=Senna tora TaxID=362788 RepID=A0A835CEV2_9FABA|nr:pentatricopeptide repeat-containing protein [Senna tora]
MFTSSIFPFPVVDRWNLASYIEGSNLRLPSALYEPNIMRFYSHSISIVLLYRDRAQSIAPFTSQFKVHRHQTEPPLFAYLLPTFRHSVSSDFFFFISYEMRQDLTAPATFFISFSRGESSTESHRPSLNSDEPRRQLLRLRLFPPYHGSRLKEFNEAMKVHGFTVKTGLSLILMFVTHDENEIQEAITIFRRMQEESYEKPDEATVVSTLSACTATKDLELGCAQLGALEQGKWIHGYIDGNKMKLDAVIKGKGYSHMDFYYLWASHEWYDKQALELFEEMKNVGARPQMTSPSLVFLSACSHGGLVQEGRKIFHSIERKLIKLSQRYNTMGVSLIFLVELDCYTKQRNFMAIFTWVGERIAGELAKMEYSDSSLHTLLANIYASADRWEDVSKVRRSKMKELGIRKVPGC